MQATEPSGRPDSSTRSCAILTNHKLPCKVQVELYGTATSKPEVDCQLMRSLKAKGASVSAFDAIMAKQTWTRLKECK